MNQSVRVLALLLVLFIAPKNAVDAVDAEVPASLTSSKQGSTSSSLADHVVVSPVEGVWGKQQIWSLLATEKRNKMNFWRDVKMGTLGTSALFQSIGKSKLPHAKICGIIGKASLAMVWFLDSFKLGSDDVADHVKCRYVAESIKSKVYMYQALAFGGDGSDGIRTPFELENEVDAIEKNPGIGKLSLALHHERKQLGGNHVKKIPSPPEGASAKEVQLWYDKHRIQDQMNYREAKMGKLEEAAKRDKMKEKFANFVFKAVGGALILDQTLVDQALTSYKTAEEVSKWASTSQLMHDNYKKSREDLERLQQNWNSGNLNWESYVDQGEKIILGENQAWAKTLVNSDSDSGASDKDGNKMVKDGSSFLKGPLKMLGLEL